MSTDGPYNEVVSAILVTIQYPGMGADICAEHLEELKGLVRTLGIEVRDASIAKVSTPRPRYLVGSGKAGELGGKSFSTSRKATNKSASKGREGRSKMPT